MLGPREVSSDSPNQKSPCSLPHISPFVRSSEHRLHPAHPPHPPPGQFPLPSPSVPSTARSFCNPPAGTKQALYLLNVIMDQWRNTIAWISENVYICLKTPVFLGCRQNTASLTPSRDTLWEDFKVLAVSSNINQTGLRRGLCSGTDETGPRAHQPKRGEREPRSRKDRAPQGRGREGARRHTRETRDKGGERAVQNLGP